MPGHEYEPKDSRDVTRQQNTPGKSTHWREKEGAVGDSDRGELEPDDSRDVTRHQNAPGEPTGWREQEDGAAQRSGGDEPLPDAAPPAGVRQKHPVSAEEAARAKRPG